MRIEPGTQFGLLTVICDYSHKRVVCRCTCGKQKSFIRHNLVSGATNSCGCLRSRKLKEKWASFISELTPENGTVFCRLTVIGSNRQMIKCLCDCGQIIEARKYDLLRGYIQSCGCLAKEMAAEKMRTLSTQHGDWGSKEWNSWHSMHERCLRQEAMGYENYGGRGISICKRWLNVERGMGFANFLQDMGRAPSSEHTLDRIDSEGNYEPSNTRWATKKEQARNRRTNRLITAFGRTQCLAAWAEESGWSSTTISLRLLKGWSPEKAVAKRE